MPLQSTSGAASYDAFGGGVPVVPKYIEEYFSTFLYSGTGAAQTITNGIDLSTKGGLVWLKNRTTATDHGLFDTVRGAGYRIISNTTDAQNFSLNYVSSFNTTGFSLGAPSSSTNASGDNYVSWSWAKAPKFFDVVTYTGNGSTQTISHNLGSTVGCIIVKSTSASTGWGVYHRSVGNTAGLILNGTNASITDSGFWNNTSPTSTQFTVGSGSAVNTNGATYVAYLFAHDAGGFGLTGTDNVISCGSFTDSTTVSLGYEPQLVLIKPSSITGNWQVIDNMRQWVGTDAASSDALGGKFLAPNLSNAEATTVYNTNITPTGFKVDGITAGTYIYIAIRRGPMKVPTSGTSVFDADVYSGTGTSGVKVTTTFPVDLAIIGNRTSAETYNQNFTDRLRGPQAMISSPRTGIELTTADWVQNLAFMDGFNLYNDASVSASGTNNHIAYSFRRAPTFFDEVCYTGDSTLGRAIPHNLAAVPEFMIVKNRNNAENWVTYSAATGNTKRMILNTNAASGSRAIWANTTPTATNFYVGGSGVLGETNASASIYIAYLFATCAGVSKVGSYTGTATTLQIDCGFTAGARFVLIKRTDSTGDWYVWDTARGIVAGNDPYLLLNSTAAETTSTDYIDTYSAGFELSSTAPAAINASGGTFIFLAIA